jgi:pimeloyl-ACP methyl ester carboxylesterase
LEFLPSVPFTRPKERPSSRSPLMAELAGRRIRPIRSARPGADEVQLDLFGDYKNNISLYPAFQNYFRTHKPPFLAVWGKHDPFFLPAGASAFKRDIPRADVRFYDTGHFALETHAGPIALAMREFLSH